MVGRNPSPSAWRRRGCFSSKRVHVLSLSLFRKSGGSALTPPPTKTEARPSSWSPSLLAPSAHVGVLIHFYTGEAFGSSLAACRTAEPWDLLVSATLRREVGPGGNPLPFRGPVVPCISSYEDGVAHLRSWLHVLLDFLGNQGCWSHLGIIRGTPCSTVATVAPGHSFGGSGGQGYGQTSWPQWTQHPATILHVGLAVDDVEMSPRVQS